MVLRVAAFICLFVTLLISTVCPFFRQTRRGIFLLHWVFINWLFATNWFSFKHIHNESNFALLLPIATLLLVTDQLFKQPLEDRLLCIWSLFSLTLLLIAIDATAIIISFNFKLEAALTTLFVMIFVFIFLLIHQEKHAFEQSFNEQMDDSTNSIFNDNSTAFHALGNLGCLFYLAITCNLLREVVPYLQLSTAFTYLIYVVQSLGTLSFITTPAYIGGLIQTLKAIGAALAEYGNKEKQLGPLLV